VREHAGRQKRDRGKTEAMSPVQVVYYLQYEVEDQVEPDDY